MIKTPYQPGATLWTPNSAEMRLSAAISANAADVVNVPDGQWALVAPYGDFKSPDGTYVQRFTREQAEKLVSAWNSLTGMAARVFKNAMHALGAKASVPVWDGHPESDKSRWPQEKLLAEITELRAGDSGLEGRITWNAQGLVTRTRGPLYPSPLWWHMPPSGTPPTVYPELLESVGLVPTPNIGSVPAWTQNATLDAAGIAIEIDGHRVSLADYTSRQQALRTIVQKRMMEGDISYDQAFAECSSDPALKPLFDAMQAPYHIVSTSTKETLDADKKTSGKTSIEVGGRTFSLTDPHSRRQALEAAVQKRMKDNGISYDMAYVECFKDPALKPLVDAMADPTRG